MSPAPSSRDSGSRRAARRSLLALGVACLVAWAVTVRAQELWYKVYEDGERAFEKHDYAQAEQLLLRSMRLPSAPKDRGVGVKRYSQIFGVIPEYYLAVICSSSGRTDEAYLYAQTVTTTKNYFRGGDARLKEMDNIVTAWTAAHPATDRSVTLGPPTPLTPSVVGPNHALLIGINDYTQQPKLKTAVADATAVGELLQKEFGFETKLLLNASRADILHALNDYRRTLTELDNLLIYYAGHGFWDQKDNSPVYWLPVDAEKDDTTNWIISDDVTSLIQKINARHVLLISDSCYAGGILREATLEEAKRDRATYLRKMIIGPSRSLLASGGLAPVSDAGGEGHSVFAAALLFHLGKTRDEPAFTADTLFQDIRVSVAGRSGQIPVYRQMLKASEHITDNGDFVFMRQPPVVKAPSSYRR